MNHRPHLPAKLARIGGWTAVAALVIGSPGVITATTAVARPAAATAPAIDVVPKPVSTTTGTGQFTLGPSSRILAAPGTASDTAAELAIAGDLAAYLRPATGYQLPTAVGSPAAGDVVLQIGNPGSLKPANQAEGYQLTTTTSGATIEAPTAHGLYNGIQTFRQLLPPWIGSATVAPGPWTTPVVTITDFPRYQYRGVLLDIARHYEPPSAVEQLIDQVAAYKINTLHLHLSDDQGFRLAINGFPRLTSIGSAGSVGTGGRSEDPGGFWTQAQYQAVVAYAAAHFITLMPEVDSPGHNNAIIMSEYNDTGNPLLPADPHGINCGQNNPPQWDYTEDVGYSAMCPDSSDTWAIYTAIIDQLSALSSSPYYDLGGDEVPSTLLSAAKYAQFINTEAPIVTKAGKTVMGWADIAGAGTTPPAGSVAEYWQPASGSQPGTETGREAVAKNMKVVMAPANHTYLDQKYIVTANSSVPASLGMNWACPTGCDVSSAYNWNPGSLVNGVTDKNVIGVEGDMWGETVATISNADYMVFPRLLALAEVAWSPSAQRSGNSAAYKDFLQRLAAQGNRLQISAVNFYPSTQVPWQLAAEGAALTASSGGQVSGTLAKLSAPGFPTSTLTMCDGSLGIGCTVDWGDGSATTTGDVTGTNATDTTVNSLYTISGAHTYAKPGTYHGTVTLSAGSAPSVTAAFTVTVP
ncbi:MAG TPA: family 20 glycosylhydrolase [Streptosporangiaceae bacterium]|nr:family 20 glycosylhydrolase [Streptosporangiaceae bacterium]